MELGNGHLSMYNNMLQNVEFLLLLSLVCSGSKTAIVTNTTVQIVVPEDVIGSVYGENGSNLARLRQVPNLG